ncbi:hypothetical protein MMC12_007074 [Toensbergia leucococca]|nr:hypothetical protein [Toensbergia leucococca]
MESRKYGRDNSDPDIIRPEPSHITSPVARRRSSIMTPTSAMPTAKMTIATPLVMTLPPTLATSESTTGLIQSLEQCFQTVITTATLTSQADMARIKRDKQNGEVDRWHKHHALFVSLAEEQMRETKKINAVTNRIAKDLDMHKESQANAVRSMALNMMAVSSGKVVSHFEDDKRVRSMENELKEFKGEVRMLSRDAKTDSELVEGSISEQRILQKQLYDLRENMLSKKNLLDIESKVAEHTVMASKVQASLSQHADQLTTFQERLNTFRSLQANINQTEEKISELDKSRIHQKDILEALELNFSKSKEDFQELSENLTVQQKSLSVLENLVSGSGQDDKDNILDQFIDLERNVNKHRDNLANFNKELNEFNDDLGKQDNRITELEARGPSRALSSSGDSAALKPTEMRLSAISEDLVRFEKEQGDKDALVSQGFIDMEGFVRQEVTRIDTSINALRAYVDATHAIKTDLQSTTTQLQEYRDEYKTALEQVQNSMNQVESVQNEQGSSLEQFRTSFGRVERVQHDQKSLLEQVQNSFNRLESNLGKVRNDFIAAVSHIQSNVPKIQAQSPAPATPSNPPTPQLPQRGFQTQDDVLKHFDMNLMKHDQEIGKLRDKQAALEQMTWVQQQRMDNLSTEGLAHHILHQMRVMYPYAHNVQAEIKRLKDREVEIAQQLVQSNTTLDSLDQRVNSKDLRLDGLKELVRIPDMMRNLETLEKVVSTVKEEAEDNKGSIKSLQEEFQEVKQVFASAITTGEEKSHSLEKSLTYIKGIVISDVAGLHGKVEAINQHLGILSPEKEDDDDDQPPSHSPIPSSSCRPSRDTSAQDCQSKEGQEASTNATPSTTNMHGSKRKRYVVSGSDDDKDDSRDTRRVREDSD